jgi:hypothetical protein
LTRLSLPYDLPEASLLHEDENKKNSSELWLLTIIENWKYCYVTTLLT